MAKRKSKISGWARNLLWVLLCLAVLMVSYQNRKYFRRVYRYITHRYYKTEFKPSDFPDGYEVHGIDVSHHQDVIAWDKLRAISTEGDTISFQFVYIKATEGILREDDMFSENWDDAKDHRLIRGAYHYFLPDRSAKLQAANYISTVKLKPGDLPPAIDVEEVRGKSKAEIVTCLKEFAGIIEAHYKVKPIIYSNINFIEDYLADDFKEYKFWVAHFYQYELVTGDSIQWVFWQHSDKADLLGINGNVDANVFNGGREAFDSILITGQ